MSTQTETPLVKTEKECEELRKEVIFLELTVHICVFLNLNGHILIEDRRKNQTF